MLVSCLHTPELRPIALVDEARARSTRWHDPYLDEPHTWEEIEAHVFEWMEANDVAWSEKTAGFGKWSRAATAFCDTVVTPQGFWDRDIWNRVRVEVHEVVHVRQCREFGQLLFGLRYADAGARWSFEANADTEGLRAMVSAGVSAKNVEAQARKEAAQLHGYYELTPYRPDEVEAVTFSIHMSAVRR